VTFGPPDMALLMQGVQATIAVVILSSVVAGIVLGSIVTCYEIIRAKQQGRRADPTILVKADKGTSPLDTWSHLELEPFIKDVVQGLHRSRHSGSAYGRQFLRTFISRSLLFAIVLAVGGGAFYWYHTPNGELERPLAPSPVEAARPLESPPVSHVGSEFERVYNQLGIQPLPSNVERREQIQSRLDQLNREACYTDAIVGLGRALLAAGYPREAANSLRSFVKRCGSAPEVLPVAYSALERINDFSGALEVANELVEALPANATFRYWRALAYDRTGQFSLAVVDYMNTVQLFDDQKIIFGDVFYKWSRTYAALGRYCDAITPIEMYISLDPVNRRTSQTVKIISDYAEQGSCNNRYTTGTARVSFAGKSNVRTLTVVVNGVAGNLILDTGATFVSITSQFARKAKVATESGNQVILKTVGGKALADVGYAKSVSVGKAEALGVATAVLRDDSNPFGNRIDGLLGMSFLSRFNVKLSPAAIELTAIPLR
jgi:clan AA aspartic protease (TIGR02281 family)